MPEHRIRTDSGRQLRVLEEGDPRGRPIFWLHGNPGSRLLPPAFIRDAQEKRVRLIAYDRPGFGESTPHRGRNVAEVGKEVASIADGLGIDRFGVWGISGGGAPALACAATLPKRVVATISAAGVAPINASGLDWFAGMSPLSASSFKLALTDQSAFETLLRGTRDRLMASSADEIRGMGESLLSDVDRALAAELHDFVILQIREGLRQGAEGGIDDALSQVSPWGFELSSIRCPVQLWHGRKDGFVPLAHGEWLAAHIPKVDAHLPANEGHLSLLRFAPEFHAWLVSRF